MKKKNPVLLGFAVLALGIVLGFSPLKNDNPTKTNPTDSRKGESAKLTEQDGPILPVGGYDTDGTPYYTDNFDGANDTVALKARGYFVWYRGTGPQGLTSTWFQGNSTVFAAFNGPATGYVAANFNAVTGTNTIDSWLITPANNVAAGDSIVFYSRSPLNSIYPDSVRVMYSTAGSTTPEGTWIELGRFKVNTAGAWERKAFGTPSAASGARFAIRYNVVDGGPLGNNSDFIGIDALTIEGVALANDMAASAIVAPVGSISQPTPAIAPKATFTNIGSANQTNVPVRFSITGPTAYTSNKTIPSINAGASATVTFDSTFNPAIGSYTATAIVSLGSDGNRFNDTIRTTFVVSNPNYGTNGAYSYANNIPGNGAPSSPEYCWKDTTGSISLVNGITNNLPAIFTGTLDDGYWKLGAVLGGKKVKIDGVSYDSVYVTTNGVVAFAFNSSLSAFSPSINSSNRPAFYPLWMDQDFRTLAVGSSSQRVSYKVQGYQLIVTYDRAPAFGSDTTEFVSYQAVIDLVDPDFPGNSNMLVNFGDVASGRTGADFLLYYTLNQANSHLVGLQTANGSSNPSYRFANPTPSSFAGPLFGASPVAVEFGTDANRLNSKCGSASLSLRVLFEGPYESSTNFNSPVEVLLRKSTAPYEIVDAASTVLDSLGNGTFAFTKINSGGESYYIVVKSLISIETWSANPIAFPTGDASYDFTTGVGQAFGSNMRLISGVSTVYVADVNKDGFVDVTDGALIDNDAFNFTGAYTATDVNWDNFVDITDGGYGDNNAFNFVSVARP